MTRNNISSASSLNDTETEEDDNYLNLYKTDQYNLK